MNLMWVLSLSACVARQMEGDIHAEGVMKNRDDAKMSWQGLWSISRIGETWRAPALIP
jgi:hypothetical protein